jgi:cysteine desulfurase
MRRERVYLDWNATAPLLPAARDAFVAALDCIGNPSSVHQEGRRARALVEHARADVAALVGAAPAQVTFTSGGTEAANLVLGQGFIPRDRRAPDLLLVSAGEHACVLEGHHFPAERVRLAPLNQQGQLDLDALAALLEAVGEARVMLALQAANNETGVVQPVCEAAALVHARGGIVVCDIVQAAGRIACGFEALDADALILSAHKIGGAKGVGALVLRDPQANIEAMLLRGGGQERGLRAGTENVAGIAAFGIAARHVREQDSAGQARLATLRDGLERRLMAALPDLTIFGAGVTRLSNTTAFGLSGLAASTLLIALDLEGFAVSSGSACSSGKVKASHVLAAMGIAPELAQSAIRVSLGRDTRADEIDAFCDAYVRVAERIGDRRRSAA